MNTKNLIIALLILISLVGVVGAFQQRSKLDSTVKAVCEYDARTQTVDSQNACGLALDRAGKTATCDSDHKCKLEDR